MLMEKTRDGLLSTYKINDTFTCISRRFAQIRFRFTVDCKGARI